jgi:ferredoxin-NADP reductase/Na+-translocating ferredoxin:NAD+ oxidoreductase RnfD subunit
MYRLVLYCLIFWLAVAFVFSWFKILPYQPLDIVVSAVFITAACLAVNLIFASVFGAPSNTESVYITALILALIITPRSSFDYMMFMAWAAILAMASKYILAIGKKHLFNPAALAVVLTALALNLSANWWIANLSMAPFILVGGLLIVRKIKRTDLVFSFFIAALLTILIFNMLKGGNPLAALRTTLLYSPIMFFAFVMLTEPMTTPPTKKLQVIYGILTGFLFAPAIHLGSIYSTPELALVVGNIFSYAVSPKHKLILRLKEKIKVASDSYDFIFLANQKMNFKPGQYMEWTLEHGRRDNRGMRRFFTIASSPTEKDIRLGVKFYDKPSSFKQNLMAMRPGETIVASQLAGNFVLPPDRSQKLVFIAGGIGVTPFRSMVKQLIDTSQQRDITIFYFNKSEQDIAYKDIFDEAQADLGLKVIYALTDLGSISPVWRGMKGPLSPEIIKQEVLDYKERLFYLSGPRSMVVSYEEVLSKLGVSREQIKIDYFPGFA